MRPVATVARMRARLPRRPARADPGRRGAERQRRPSRVLLAGSFSIDNPDRPVTTAGDLLACEVAAHWLDGAGVAHDVALAPPFQGGVDWRAVEPSDYSHVVWVCGPVGQGRKQTAFRDRFRGSTLVGLDVTMLDDLEPWNPFDVLVERDSVRAQRPDISLLADERHPPVVGLCLIHRQRHYARARHDAVQAAFQRLIASRPMSVVAIDTVIDSGSPGRRSPGEVGALLARMDVVLTNRLHGLVLSLKHGVPAVAVDGVEGGAKVSRQARALGWPVVLGVDSLTDERLAASFEYCLTPEARGKADAAGRQGRQAAARVEREFLAALGAAAPD
jgi:Polysaccharide pyruvyl transferase